MISDNQTFKNNKIHTYQQYIIVAKTILFIKYTTIYMIYI